MGKSPEEVKKGGVQGEIPQGGIRLLFKMDEKENGEHQAQEKSFQRT